MLLILHNCLIAKSMQEEIMEIWNNSWYTSILLDITDKYVRVNIEILNEVQLH